MNYLMSLGVEVWNVVLDGYSEPTLLISGHDKLELSYNAKAKNAVQCGLSESEFIKVIH